FFATLSGFALGQPQYVENRASPDSFLIADGSGVATLFVDTNDFPGVIRAVNDLQADIVRVTGQRPPLKQNQSFIGTNAILIGKTHTNDELIRARKMNASPNSVKWESLRIQVVPQPFPGIRNGLIIAGSDKRGTIYGVYDLCEQIGVSPWYWWADVPIMQKSS